MGKTLTRKMDDECKQIAKTIAWMLVIDTKTEVKIETAIRKAGVKTFFNNLESFDLQDEVIEKLLILREVINYIDTEEPRQRAHVGGVYQ